MTPTPDEGNEEQRIARLVEDLRELGDHVHTPVLDGETIKQAADLIESLQSQLSEARGERDALRRDAEIGRRLQLAIKCELFQDGVEADLHSIGIDTVAEAYMRGRLDLYDECDISAPPSAQPAPR